MLICLDCIGYITRFFDKLETFAKCLLISKAVNKYLLKYGDILLNKLCVHIYDIYNYTPKYVRNLTIHGTWNMINLKYVKNVKNLTIEKDKWESYHNKNIHSKKLSELYCPTLNSLTIKIEPHDHYSAAMCNLTELRFIMPRSTYVDETKYKRNIMKWIDLTGEKLKILEVSLWYDIDISKYVKSSLRTLIIRSVKKQITKDDLYCLRNITVLSISFDPKYGSERSYHDKMIDRSGIKYLNNVESLILVNYIGLCDDDLRHLVNVKRMKLFGKHSKCVTLKGISRMKNQLTYLYMLLNKYMDMNNMLHITNVMECHFEVNRGYYYGYPINIPHDIKKSGRGYIIYGKCNNFTPKFVQ